MPAANWCNFFLRSEKQECIEDGEVAVDTVMGV